MSSLRFRIKMFQKYKDLIKELVVRDVKLKYRRSVLGYVWSILNPLLIMIVMTVVFSAMFKRNIENYPVYLLCGMTKEQLWKMQLCILQWSKVVASKTQSSTVQSSSTMLLSASP